MKNMQTMLLLALFATSDVFCAAGAREHAKKMATMKKNKKRLKKEKKQKEHEANLMNFASSCVKATDQTLQDLSSVSTDVAIGYTAFKAAGSYAVSKLKGEQGAERTLVYSAGDVQTQYLAYQTNPYLYSAYNGMKAVLHYFGY